MIRLLRLKSGEDLVADIDINADTITLENPAMLMPMGGGQGSQVQMGFGPWVPFTKEKNIEVPKDWVVFIVEPEESITNNYRQMFGSGLVVPEVRVDTKQVLTG
tara:strand:- start:6948 stop:7259 length:312 start_codon:yes stop_codon:yes gene_type:complete